MAQRAGEGFDRLYETARALGEETRFRIYRRIWLSATPVGVTDLAGHFSLHPNAVRQHLARLEQAGLVTSRLDRGGGAGRPRRLFEPAPERMELTAPPGAPRALVAMLARAMDELPGDRRKLVEFGQAWGRSWSARRRRGSGRAPRSRRARVELLARELAEWGWRPASEGANGTLRITTGRCLFHDKASGDHGRSCAIEEGLLRGLAEAALNGEASSAEIRGCRLDVRLEAAIRPQQPRRSAPGSEG